jgi:hypothetical protein
MGDWDLGRSLLVLWEEVALLPIPRASPGVVRPSNEALGFTSTNKSPRIMISMIRKLNSCKWPPSDLPMQHRPCASRSPRTLESRETRWPTLFGNSTPGNDLQSIWQFNKEEVSAEENCSDPTVSDIQRFVIEWISADYLMIQRSICRRELTAKWLEWLRISYQEMIDEIKSLLDPDLSNTVYWGNNDPKKITSWKTHVNDSLEWR